MAAPLVTPEGVVLELDLAGLPTRLLARVVDLVLIALGAGLLLLALGALAAAGVPEVPLVVVGLALVPGVLFGYATAFEALWRGRTPGKAALGLRVITAEGGPVRFRHCFIRAAADLIDVYGLALLPGAVGAIAIVAGRRSQRVGDVVAGTVVVRERSGAPTPRPVRFDVPPSLEPWAATVDVSALGPDERHLVRSFLVRADGLRPEARAAVAAEVAAAVAARCRVAPPAWLGAEAFLAVVAARLQARPGGGAVVPR